MNLFMFRRTPRVLRGGISGTLEFASSRKTPRKSRLALASPAMGCECAMEPIGSFLFSGSSSCLLLQGFRPDLRSHHKEALLVVTEKGRRRILQQRASAASRGGFCRQRPLGAILPRNAHRACNG